MCLWLEWLIPFQPTTIEYQEVKRHCYGRIMGGNVIGDAPERKYFKFLYSGPCAEFLRWRPQSCLTDSWPVRIQHKPGVPLLWWLSLQGSRSAVCSFSLLTTTQGALTGQKGSEHLCYHMSLCQQLAAAHTQLFPRSETSEWGTLHLLKQQPCRSWKGAATRSMQPTHCNECNECSAMQTDSQCKHVKHLNIFL